MFFQKSGGRRRLTAVALAAFAAALCATPAEAAASFSLACGSARAGSDIACTVSRAAGGKGVSVLFMTTDGSAKAGTDYTAVKQSLYFKGGSLSQTVAVHTLANPAATGTLTFKAWLSDGLSVVSAAGSIIEPVAAPPANNNPLVGQSLGVGAADIPTADHDVLDDLMPAWGTGAIPVSNAPGDNVGAFRFICRHTNLANDDPTVFPGQPGASHLHDQTGVFGWSAFSNYGNLRTSGGGSGCNDVAGNDHDATKTTHSANRTPYWQPALLDGKGNVILADYTSFYYKRRPKTDPLVSDPANPQYVGQAVPLPNGIKFIFGAFASDPTKAPVPDTHYNCTNGPPGVVYLANATFADAIACARSHDGGTLEVFMSAPDCWDGVHLDSADHRSHMAYGTYTQPNGYYKCDAAHPFVIPTFTYAAFYSILPTDDGDIHFSSDEMDNTKPRGWSFHVDYGPAAWDPQVKMMWENGCINQLLNCSGGDLGNGKQLKGASVPFYLSNGTWTSAWRNPQHLVPVPGMTMPMPPAPSPSPAPAPSPTFGADVLSEGDSISYFWGGSHTGIYAATHPAVVFKGNAVSGSQINDPVGGNGLMQRQAADLLIHPKVMTVLIGGNDVFTVGLAWGGYPNGVQQYLDALFNYIAPFRAAGAKVAVGTILPQCSTGNPASGNDLLTNTNRKAVNDGIRAAVGTKIDAVIDFAADPVMGPDQAACDQTLYLPDGIHPTYGAAGGVGGQGKLELIYAPVVDALLAH